MSMFCCCCYSEYLKLRFLSFEERLIDKKQQTHHSIQRISSTSSKHVTTHNEDTIRRSDAEFDGVLEHDDPIVELKGHVGLMENIMDAVTMEMDHLRDVIEVSEFLNVE